MNTEEDSWGKDEGARPSSLISVHKLPSPDVHYDLQLRRELEIANARTRAELGPLPPDGLPVMAKRKPNLRGTAGACVDAPPDGVAETPSPDDYEPPMSHNPQEDESMRLHSLAMAAAVGAATLVGGPASASPRDSIRPTAGAEMVHGVPEHFEPYLKTPVGDDGTCVAGKVTDEDGMFSRPFVYVTDAVGGRVKWARFLDMPEAAYEGRATHCVRKGSSLYVLLQIDIRDPRSLPQTLQRMVKVGMDDGGTQGAVDVPVPGVERAYTSWVWDDDGLSVVNGTLLVTGQYRYIDMEDGVPFSATVNL
ncbi:hypothetical protein ACVWWJ_004052 [Luteibacter sp. HA06]